MRTERSTPRHQPSPILELRDPLPPRGAPVIRPPRYVRHVTLNTGHARNSLPGEVDAAVLTRVTDHLDRALAGDGGDPVPGVEGPRCVLTADAHGRCLLATVWAAPDEGPEPLVTFGVAAHSRCGAPLWRMIHDAAVGAVATDRDQAPPAPWCGVLLHPGIGRWSAAATWLGDYERCVAWAWVRSAVT